MCSSEIGTLRCCLLSLANLTLMKLSMDIPDIETEIKDIDEKNKEIRPIKKVHYLISVIDLVLDVQDIH